MTLTANVPDDIVAQVSPQFDAERRQVDERPETLVAKTVDAFAEYDAADPA